MKSNLDTLKAALLKELDEIGGIHMKNCTCEKSLTNVGCARRRLMLTIALDTVINSLKDI